jgi:hypothetical protein
LSAIGPGLIDQTGRLAGDRLDLKLQPLPPLGTPCLAGKACSWNTQTGAGTRKRRAPTESRARRLPMGRRPAFEEVEGLGGGPSTHRACERGAQNLSPFPYPSARRSKHQSFGG